MKTENFIFVCLQMHVTAVFEHQAASYLQQKDATKLAMIVHRWTFDYFGQR